MRRQCWKSNTEPSKVSLPTGGFGSPQRFPGIFTAALGTAGAMLSLSHPALHFPDFMVKQGAKTEISHGAREERESDAGPWLSAARFPCWQG